MARGRAMHGWKVVCVLCLLLAVGMQSAALAGSSLVNVVNNPNPADRLNLRTAPSTRGDSLLKYYNGVVVDLVSLPQNGWVHVRIGDVDGYMQERYIAFNVQPGQVKSAIPYAWVNNPNPSDRLNLRSWMDTIATSLGKYSNGTRVEVLGYSDQWCHVRVDGRTGFMQTRYLAMEEQRPQPVPPPSGGGKQPPAIDWAIVKNPNPSDRLNLRDSVGARGETIPHSMGKYYSGVEVEILNYLDYPQDAWVWVRIGDTFGFMQKRFLAINARPGEVRSVIPTVTITNPKAGDRLNLRMSASSTSPSLGKYPTGTRVEVLGVTQNGWNHVRLDGGKTGYMMNKFLTPQPKF